MAPTLILFDIDGTLVDLAGAGRAALERAFHETFGVEPDRDRTGRVAFGGKTDPTIVRELGIALGIERGELESGAARLEESYLAALDRELARPEPKRRLLPGVQPLLDRLAEHADAHLGLLTGNIEGGARRKLATFDLNRFFPGGGFGSDADDRRGVAREARRRMAELVGIDFPASRVTVVGDTENDVDCARANGFRAVAVRTGWAQPGGLEASRPDALLDDLDGGDAVLESLGLPA